MNARHRYCERLETRRLLTVYVVNDPGDAADPSPWDAVIDVDPATPGEQRTLRAVIQTHNEHRLTNNSVQFDGVTSIRVGSTGLGALPGVLGTLDIYGGTGAARVELDGSLAGPGAVGLSLRGGNCHVLGLVINRFSSHGVLLSGTGPPGTGGHYIRNCFIGTDATGMTDLGNGGHGILIEGGTPSNVIGGPFTDDGNVISGNGGDGVHVEPHLFLANPPGNYVLGNYIGTSANGSGALGNDGAGVYIDRHPNGSVHLGNVISGNLHGVVLNGSATANVLIDGNKIGTDAGGTLDLGNQGDGVRILGARNNNIGEPDTWGTGNVVSGNGDHGVFITGPTATGNVLRKNRIGTDTTGVNALGNAFNGVAVVNGASNNLIGTGVAGQGNTIAFNGGAATPSISGHGVLIESGTGNAVRRNSIFGNAGRGIDLGGDSFTVNGVGDGNPGGANGLQDYPVVTKLTFAGGNKTIDWALESAPSRTFTVEFFKNDEADQSGFGEGKTFLRERVVTTNTNGIALFTETFPESDGLIAATATDSDGNTSEFSMVDTDGDAAADRWETDGIDYNEDGTPDLLLKSNPNHKDLFVEVDGMTGLTATQATLDTVVAAFAAAPNSLVQNPDGANGITLHATTDETSFVPASFPGQWTEFDDIKKYAFGTVKERNTPWAIDAKRLVYRYALFAKEFALPPGPIRSYSGFSELPPIEREIDPFGRNDLCVTLGHSKWTGYGVTPEIQAGTFMHELGHSLGLHHGGDDEFMNKPNYHSVMNYTWQYKYNPIAGARLEYEEFRKSWTLDYSRDTFNTLNEHSLSETYGIGGHPGHTLPLGPFGTNLAGVQFVAENGAVDWNQNGSPTDDGISYNINRDANFTELTPFVDWPALRYYFLENKNTQDGDHSFGDEVTPPPESSFEEFERLVGDVTPPVVAGADFPYALAPHRLRLTFSEYIWDTLDKTDLVVQRVGGGSVPIDHVTYDVPSNTATFYFDGVLPDGNYRALLPAGTALDLSGNTLAEDFLLEFFVLAGDANHDRWVNFDDLVPLAQHYNTYGGNAFYDGDFNYDGDVDFDDLVILAQHYNTTLPPPPATPAQAKARGRPASRALFSVAPVSRPAPAARSGR